MMNQLTTAIQKDLNILKLGEEDSVQFEGRLLYAAFSAWCRNMMNDLSFSDVSSKPDYLGVDRNHVVFRLSQVIEGFFNVFHYGKLYFQSNDKGKIDNVGIAKRIVDDLLFSFECSSSLEQNKILNTPESYLFFENNEILLLGGKKYKSENKYSFTGCGKWLRVYDQNICMHNACEFFGIPNKSSIYLDDLCENAEWKESKVDSSFQILSLSNGIESKYNKWLSYNKKYITTPLSIIRNGNRYYLMKEIGNSIKTAELNSWYRDEKEIYRIIFAIKEKYLNSQTVKAEINRDSQYVILSLDTALPNSETRILLLSSWGYKHAFDRYKRIIPLFLWKEISTLLEKLGLNIIYT